MNWMVYAFLAYGLASIITNGFMHYRTFQYHLLVYRRREDAWESVKWQAFSDIEWPFLLVLLALQGNAPYAFGGIVVVGLAAWLTQRGRVKAIHAESSWPKRTPGPSFAAKSAYERYQRLFQKWQLGMIGTAGLCFALVFAWRFAGE